jgi:hypothetical protein
MAKRHRKVKGEAGLFVAVFYLTFAIVALPFWLIREVLRLNAQRGLPTASPRGKYTARAQRYKGVVMDSGAEVKFAKLLDRHGILWIKNTRAFPWRDGKRKRRWYVPDFYLPDHDLWVEIKGRAYYTNQDRTKWKHFPHNHEVVWASNIRLPRKLR